MIYGSQSSTQITPQMAPTTAPQTAPQTAPRQPQDSPLNPHSRTPLPGSLNQGSTKPGPYGPPSYYGKPDFQYFLPPPRTPPVTPGTPEKRYITKHARALLTRGSVGAWFARTLVLFLGDACVRSQEGLSVHGGLVGCIGAVWGLSARLSGGLSAGLLWEPSGG